MFRLAIIMLVALSLANCAQESAPQGGKKDTTPPKAKRISPPNKTLHFAEKKIEFTFNEFIKPTGFAQTLVSPPMDKKPIFTVKGKTLTVKLKSPLRDSTTYTINFAEDVKDLNEGNIANNFVYVFSTGNFIDSQKIAGKLTNAKDNSPADAAIVALYPADTIDGITNAKPFYFAKTDKSGMYQISNVKAGRYRIYGLKDQNYNYMYDQPNELIAFTDSIIELRDSLFPKVDLALFGENRGKASFTGARSIAPGLVQVTYSKALKNVKIESDLAHQGSFAYEFDTKDTINYWYSDFYQKRGTLYLAANDTLLDTTTIELKFIDKDSFVINTYNALSIVNQTITAKQKEENKINYNTQEAYKPVKITFSRPITEVNKAKSLQILQDSSTKTFIPIFSFDDSTRQHIYVDFEKTENTGYTLIIPDSTFKDIFGFWNLRLTYKFKVTGKDGYGNIHVILRSKDPNKHYIVNLLNAADELIKRIPFENDTVKKITINNALAGTYKVMAIDDANQNGKWDTGNFKTKKQPEHVLSYKDTYALKGGWDLDIEVKF